MLLPLFLFYRFRSTCVTNVGNSLRRSPISLDTRKRTSNLLKPIPATSAEKNSVVSIIVNATRNPTTTQLPVLFVANFVIEGKHAPSPSSPRKKLSEANNASSGTCFPEPRPSNSHAKRRRIHNPQSSNIPSIEPNILPEDPETRMLYLRHWNTIQTQENSGKRVQDRYNFTLNDITSSTFPEMVRNIFTQQRRLSESMSHLVLL